MREFVDMGKHFNPQGGDEFGSFQVFLHPPGLDGAPPVSVGGQRALPQAPS